MRLFFSISYLLFFHLLSFCQTPINKYTPILTECSNNTKLTKSEKQACSDQKLVEFIYDNLKYPALARENGMEGTVLIELIIDNMGTLEKGIVLRAPNPEKAFFKEGTRLIELMKNELSWATILANDTSDKISVKLPVSFTLESKKMPLLRKTEDLVNFICERAEKFSIFHVKKKKLAKIFSEEFDINSMWYYQFSSDRVNKLSVESNGKKIENKDGVFTNKMIDLVNQTSKGDSVSIFIEELIFDNNKAVIQRKIVVK